MPFWYYFTVPQLPPDVSHQSHLVEIKKYLAAEGSPIDAGTPIALVENYWAVIMLKANGQGILKRTFFEPGVSVKIGDPIAIIGGDGENLPYGKEHAVPEVIEHKRERPARQ
jgi:pyruvate dehydrogenase E2 component (dihydrolipoamide acetyltransferase)